MRYKKKPIVVEAVQFIDCVSDKIQDHFDEYPDWLNEAFKEHTIRLIFADTKHLTIESFAIATKEGDMNLTKGNWLIQGVKGELYPCNDEIFRMTYEEVNKNEK